MKKIYLLYFATILFATAICVGCSDWTEPDPKDYFEGPSEEYYAALREYKNTKHPIAFGWFGNWSGEGASLVNSLAGIPDSVDIVSIWGNSFNLSESQKKDLKFCQEKKGTKFLMCFIVHNLGDQLTPSEVSPEEFWGWEGAFIPDRPYQRWQMIDMDVTSDQEAIIRKYAQQIVDTIMKYDYDGFDIDYEPNYQGKWGSLANYPKRMSIFIDELSKHLGPKSTSGKLLVLDGEPQSMPSERGDCMDYLIVQAYNSPGDSDLNSRLRSTVENFDGVLSEVEVTEKYVVTENFEAVSVAMDGGYNYTDQYGNKMKSLEGMARWRPYNGFEKGGVGTYHMEAEYPTNPEYKHLRKAIQIMNPSPIPLVKY